MDDKVEPLDLGGVLSIVTLLLIVVSSAIVVGLTINQTDGHPAGSVVGLFYGAAAYAFGLPIVIIFGAFSIFGGTSSHRTWFKTLIAGVTIVWLPVPYGLIRGYFGTEEETLIIQ